MNRLVDYLKECMRIIPEVGETDSGWSEKPVSGRHSNNYFANFYNKYFRYRKMENAN